MKKIFLNGCYGACNLGDSIMMQITVKDIEEIFSNENFVIYIKNKGNEKCLIQNRPYIYNLKNLKKIDELILIKNSDFYWWGGGTFLYESKDNGIKSLLSILLHILVAKIFKTKIILYGIGFGPFKSFLGKKISQFVIKFADFITVRDQESFQEIVKINPKALLTADLVYRIDLQNLELSKCKLSRNKKYIILNSVYYLNDKEIKAFADFIFQKLKKMNIDFESIHFILLPAWESQNANDTISNEKLIKILLKKYNFSYDIYRNIPINKLMCLIKLSEIVFAQRLHILLIATLMGKRIFTLPYHGKINKFLKEIKYSKDGYYDKNIIEINIRKSWKNFDYIKNYLKTFSTYKK